jgi:DNA repair protein RadD
MSAGLYVQMAGRGMRMKSHTDHCMVLDFAGVVASHGPITAVQPPKKPKPGQEGEAPVKSCPECHELVPPNTKECPCCGYQFPIAQKKLKLHHDDIMGLDGNEMQVTDWRWRKHISRASGKEMLAVSYYGGLSDPPIVEYFPVTHDGYAGQKAIQNVLSLIQNKYANGMNVLSKDLDETATWFNLTAPHPTTIKYKKDGKFFKVTDRRWT